MAEIRKTDNYNADLQILLETENKLAHINENGIAVGIVASTQKKKRPGGDGVVFADCRKVPEYWHTFCPYDFLVTFYEPNCEGLDDGQMRILLFHELLHIGVKDDGGTFVRKHDVEDFAEIINRLGTDWNEVK